MYGIQYKAMNNATNTWEWRWAKDPVTHEPYRFVTGGEAWEYKEFSFPGRSLSEVRVMKETS